MNETTDPTSVSALDQHFEKATGKDVHRARWFAVATLGAVIIGVVIFLIVVVVSQQTEIHAQQAQLVSQEKQLESSCGFYRLLGTLDPAANTSGAKPGLTGVTLVVDARDTYIGQGCGPLPPPSASLVHWSAVYHIPLVQ